MPGHYKRVDTGNLPSNAFRITDVDTSGTTYTPRQCAYKCDEANNLKEN